MKKTKLKIGDIKNFIIKEGGKKYEMVGVVIEGISNTSVFNDNKQAIEQVLIIKILTLSGNDYTLFLKDIVEVKRKQLDSNTRNCLTEIAENYKKLKERENEIKKAKENFRLQKNKVENLFKQMPQKTQIYSEKFFMERLLETIEHIIKRKLINYGYIPELSSGEMVYISNYISFEDKNKVLKLSLRKEEELIRYPTPRNCDIVYSEYDSSIHLETETSNYKRKLESAHAKTDKIKVKRVKRKNVIVKDNYSLGLSDKYLSYYHSIEVKIKGIEILNESAVKKMAEVINKTFKWH